MRPRIFHVHPYHLSIPPMDAAFADAWPEAEAVRLLDSSLYADAGADGTMPASIVPRLESLFRHCAASGAKGIVFTGSTFGPAVETARRAVPIPVLKADEAMTEAAIARGRRIHILATAQRAIRVLRASLETTMKEQDVRLDIVEAWVGGAKAANDSGRHLEHDRLIADAAAATPEGDTVMLGQMSMAPAVRQMAPEIAGRAVTSPAASVSKLRGLIEGTR